MSATNAWVTVREPDRDGNGIRMREDSGLLEVTLPEWTVLTPGQWEQVKAEGDRLLGVRREADGDPEPVDGEGSDVD